MSADLSWLPPPPPDFAARIGEAEALPDAAAWDALAALARTRLDPAQTGRLDRALQRRFPSGSPAGSTWRLALLGSSTLAHLAAGIRVGALRRDLHLSVHEGAYGQYHREIDGEALRAVRPDVVLLALDAADLLGPNDPDTGEAGLTGAIDRLKSLWARARAAHGCALVQQTLLPVALPLMGGNEHRMPGSLAARTLRLNAALREAAAGEGVDLLALDEAAMRHGLDAWHDPALWLRARQAVTPAAGPFTATSSHGSSARGSAARPRPSCSTSTTRCGAGRSARTVRRESSSGRAARSGNPSSRSRLTPATSRAAASCSRCARRTIPRRPGSPSPSIPTCCCACPTSPPSWRTGTTRRRTSGASRRTSGSASTRWSSSTTTRSSARSCASTCRWWRCRRCPTSRPSSPAASPMPATLRP
ncbi:hypothetical protein F1D61_00675 [Methylobacterium aquaticum]|nr:hypothetical protein F1D61_00675 [Methylobacterium aquaticum]